MSLNEDSLAVVRKAYQCYEKHDITGLIQLIDPDCDWHLPGPADGMPWAGRYHGPEEVREFFETLTDNLEVLEFSPHQFLADGDTVMVTGHERDRIMATGKVLELDWAHCFTIEEGKITRFQDYQDTASIKAALH
jgi:ketosteroid isomerase-like protein